MSVTETPARTYSLACFAKALLVLPDIEDFSARALVAVIKSVSGRSNTSGLNRSKVFLILISNLRYSPQVATELACGK